MYRKYIKRLIDFILSLILIIILSPLFIITGILVLLGLGFPIIFKQEREGMDKKTFIMYKFRTMNWNIGDTREERLTKVTKIIDILKLNELPQLFNVLKGDMSLVGPRPFIPKDNLPIEPPKERYMVRPGMTGLAQVRGGRSISHKRKLEYDVIYNQEISFILDFIIIILTPIKIIKDYKGVKNEKE